MDMRNPWIYIMAGAILILLAKPVSWMWDALANNKRSVFSFLGQAGLVLLGVGISLVPPLMFYYTPFNKESVGVFVLGMSSIIMFFVVLILLQLRKQLESYNKFLKDSDRYQKLP